jgi:polyhydroxybutyrate depolymerase
MNRSLIVLAALMMAACSHSEPRTPGRYIEKLTVAEKPRDFILHVPKGYDHTKPTPVVVALHGLTSTAAQFEAVLKLGEESDKGGFIVAIPNGLPESFRGWNAGFFKMAGDKADVDFMKTILDRLEGEFNIDKKREYVFGHSNGAMMSYYLGSVLGDRLAAVAGISGSVGLPANGGLDTIPVPKSQVSVLLLHGKQDNVVVYKRGMKAMLQSMGADESAEWWANHFGLPVKVEAIEYKKDAAAIRQFGKSDKGAEVTLIASFNGTHEIFGGWYGAGRESKSGILAWDEIWKFFQDHPKQ